MTSADPTTTTPSPDPAEDARPAAPARPDPGTGADPGLGPASGPDPDPDAGPAAPASDAAPRASEPEPRPLPAPGPGDDAWQHAAPAEQVRGAGALQFGGRPGHVESFFLKANDPRSGAAIWIRFTVLAPSGGDPDIAEVWAIAFDKATGRHRAFKEGYPLREARLSRDRLGFRVGRNRLEDGWTRGHLQGADGRAIRWDLRFEGAGAPPLRLLGGARLYRGRFPRAKTLTPLPSARFHGEIAIDGEPREVEGWPGMLGHNWGREHAYAYAWAHVNAFEDAPESWFEAISARVRVGPIPLPYLTVLYLWHEGRAYDFRSIRHWWNRSVEVSLYRYRFTATDRDARLEGTIEAEARDLVGLVYHDPNGSAAFCLNTKVARATLRLLTPEGVERARLHTEDKGALELLVRDRDHGVRMFL